MWKVRNLLFIHHFVYCLLQMLTCKVKWPEICLSLNQLFYICQGQEVFNTYGELANWQLLHMYGFAEPSSNNYFDAVS